MKKLLIDVLVCVIYIFFSKATAGEWQPVGSYGFAHSQDPPHFTLAKDGTPFVSYTELKDWGGGCCNKKTVVSRYDSASGDWKGLGEPGFGINVKAPSPIAIDSLGILYTVVSENVSANWSPSVMRFLNNSWSSFSDSLAFYGNPDSYQLLLDADNNPYVGYIKLDYTNAGAVAMFNGDSWISYALPNYYVNVFTLAFSNDGVLYLAYLQGEVGSIG